MDDFELPVMGRGWTAFFFVASIFIFILSYVYLYHQDVFDPWETESLRQKDLQPYIYTVVILFFSAMFMLSVANFSKSGAFRRVFHATTALVFMASIILMYAVYYKNYGVCDGHCTLKNPTDPDTALYFSLSTWTTVGYGDVTPSRQMRLVAASEACFGLLSGAIIVGAIVSLFRRP